LAQINAVVARHGHNIIKKKRKTSKSKSTVTLLKKMSISPPTSI